MTGHRTVQILQPPARILCVNNDMSAVVHHFAKQTDNSAASAVTKANMWI